MLRVKLFGRRLPESPAPAAELVGPTDVVSPWSPTDNALGSVLLQELYDFKSDVADQLPPTRGEAMSVPAVARVRRTVCTTVGRMPVVTMRGRRPVASTRGLAPVGQPERGRPSSLTYVWTTDALMFFGRAWWVVVERFVEDGRPAAFEFVPEWNGIFSTTGQLIGHTDGRRFAEADVVRIDGPDEGVLSFAKRSIRGAVRLDRAWLRTAENPVPSIELHNTSTDPMTDAEIDSLVDRWVRARARSNGAVGYTSASLETKVQGQNVEQLLIEGRKAAALDLARHLGVPAWVVDVGVEGSSLTYSNVESRSRELIDYGVQGYLDAIAGRLSLDDILPRGYWAKFDTNALLTPDFKTRMEGYKAAKEAGVYTPEELRMMEDGVPLEGDTQ